MAIHIVVAIKQVPDTSNVRINPETGTLIREGVPSILNPYEVHALELAVRLKELHGGTVTVLTMGPPAAACPARANSAARPRPQACAWWTSSPLGRTTPKPSNAGASASWRSAQRS